MRVGILTPVRLLGEAVAEALRTRDADMHVDVVRKLDLLRALAGGERALTLVIVDTTVRVALDEIRAFHVEFPALPLLALGLQEHEAEIIAHGCAGFACYLHREEGLDVLCARVVDARVGRLPCSPEIAAAMMRGLFRQGAPEDDIPLPLLTKRENHVAGFVSRGFSNKEIARELTVSESTVKHHVHSILSKCRLSTRMQLMRRMRQNLWSRDKPLSAASQGVAAGRDQSSAAG
jgi:DNA-binding NarL/FixJ family response regulator